MKASNEYLIFPSFQPISTWVPPREDLTAKVKDETVQSVPQRKAQATAVIKSGFPLEKHLKKVSETGNSQSDRCLKQISR